MNNLFKQGPFPTLVAVITTQYGDITNAAPVTWFMPCSYDPPMIMVALKNKSDTLANIIENREFVIQFFNWWLAQDVHNLAKTLPRDVSELEGSDFHTEDTPGLKVKRIEEAYAYYGCMLDQVIKPIYTHSGHTVVTGAVICAEHYEREVPLLYFGGLRYGYSQNYFSVDPY
jgi:flavin reductase (DIM6/NTAB) family NADH-FMN oxidoreductase RutF